MRTGEGRRKLKVLGYADEIIQMVICRAGEEYEMVNEKMYLDRKGLMLNTDKNEDDYI